MKRLLALLLALLAAGSAFGQTPAPGQSVVQTDNVRAELLADVAAVKPGEPFWVGLRQTIRPKWHTYWKNPGESGLPTEIKWTLPEGVKADPIVWPAPATWATSWMAPPRNTPISNSEKPNMSCRAG